ncbi:MAG: type II toxin-antitoxin system RelE/ParE family toxin [Gammaproteobacteria bacterium]|nr:type II toxin-antitoxin system RelE/ParE family toxin [Gammaproteobacteria bacterium]
MRSLFSSLDGLDASNNKEIFSYTKDNWGEMQAHLYIEGMFACFKQIADDKALSHPIPAESEVIGFYTRYEKHDIYWKALQSGQIGIVTVLHERIHQMERLREDMV